MAEAGAYADDGSTGAAPAPPPASVPPPAPAPPAVPAPAPTLPPPLALGPKPERDELEPGGIGFEPEREFRIGLVMYGGVSLAVYINGVAQELLALVRSTAPVVDPETGEAGNRCHLSDGDLSPVERVYRRLGQIAGPAAAADAAARAATGGAIAPVRTRFVVDIIAGSSAGGINGVYLAKALANQQEMAALKTLWVDQAGIGNILNDAKARKPLLDRIPKREPVESLFSGDVMYAQLLGALEQMDGTGVRRPSVTLGSGALKGSGGSDRPGAVVGAPASPYVGALDLWITATDLAGANLPLRLGDQEIYEAQHRHTFHFVYGETRWELIPPDPAAPAAPATPAASKPKMQLRSIRVNQFTADHNPILAFAARATSSFPFAFEPARLADIGRIRGRDGGLLVPADPTWSEWFPHHLGLRDPGYEEVAFGDGGDIDNKPFSWVTDTLAARTSTSLVDRRIFYVEPDPGDPVPATHAAPTPDAVASTIEAVSLGRVENIREDIDRIARRTAVAEQLSTAVGAVEAQYRRTAQSEAKETSTDDWLSEPVAAMAGRGLGYAAYYELRVEALKTEFARTLAKLPWTATDDRSSTAARELVGRWVHETYDDPFVVRGNDDDPTTKWFLRDFDIAFRIRRLAFVAARADELACAELEGRIDVAGPPADREPFVRELRRIKALLAGAEEQLRWCVPGLRSARAEPPTEQVSGPTPNDFPWGPDDVALILGGGLEQFWTERGAAFSVWCKGIGAALSELIFPLAGAAVKLAFEPADKGEAPEVAARFLVGGYFDRYADFDQVTFTALTVAGVTGEIDPVSVHRISPRDATALIDVRTASEIARSEAEGPAGTEAATAGWNSDRRLPAKVAGARFGHFGGFLDATWRANDIMWGRLDTAERIIATALRTDHPQASELRDAAQDAILREEWFSPGKPGAAWLSREAVDDDAPAAVAVRRRAFVDGYALPAQPPTQDLMKLGARSTQVGNQLAQHLVGRPGSKPVARALGVVGWFLTALAAVGFPDRFRRAAFRSAAAALVLVGVALALVSAPFNWGSGADTGATLVIIGLIALTIAFLARLAWSSPKLLLVAVPVVIAVPLMAYGGWQFWENVLQTHWPFR